MSDKFASIVSFIRDYYEKPEGVIALHEPLFTGNERKYVLDAIDSTFVSSVGAYVDRFEAMMRDYTGAQFAVATVNGTAALHMSLILAGVKSNDLVITQPLTFIATCNAISYLGATPVFIDNDIDTLGMSATKLRSFLENNTAVSKNECIHQHSGKRIAACVPMHTVGHPVHLDEIISVCNEFNVPLIEDAAESIGSFYKGKHTGTLGLVGAFSFNVNKTITCGGGGMIITNDEQVGKLAKHLTTQAKLPHPWNFVHDQIGYNYRLPNLNAALACAQMEVLGDYINNKRNLAQQYKRLFDSLDMKFISEPDDTNSNYWLNTVLFNNRNERDSFLKYSNDQKVNTRPAWTLMNKLEMFKNCITGDLSNATMLEDCLVSLPSSVKIK